VQIESPSGNVTGMTNVLTGTNDANLDSYDSELVRVYTGLSPGATYTVRMGALNTWGTNPPSITDWYKSTHSVLFVEG
jgi:hypothetical protein